MSGLIQSVKSFFEFIISAVQFAIKLVKDLVYVLGMLKDVVLHVPQYLGFLPTVLITMFAMCLSVVIVYKIIGRD